MNKEKLAESVRSYCEKLGITPNRVYKNIDKYPNPFPKGIGRKAVYFAATGKTLSVAQNAILEVFFSQLEQNKQND